MTKVLIRQIQQSDIDGFWEALGSVIDEKNFLARETRPALEGTRTFVQKSIDREYIHLVALQDSNIIGWCDVLPRNESEPHIGIVGMGVIKAWRGQGIGEALLRAALNAVADKGFTTIRLDVWSENAPAIKLYEKLGFRHIKTFSRPEKPERQLADMIWDGFPA